MALEPDREQSINMIARMSSEERQDLKRRICLNHEITELKMQASAHKANRV